MLLDVIDTQGQTSDLESPAAPYVWAMTEGRVGDDKQVLALAQAIGGKVQRIEVRDGLAKTIGGRLFNSFGLHAPWFAEFCAEHPLPDILIAAGGRCASLARWVKQASGGRTRTVIVGRPWARLGDFDLIVTTPQYALPAGDNVQTNLLPLNHIEIDPNDRMIAQWASRLNGLPGPWTGVLLGGDSGSYRFTGDCARRLAQRLNEIARQTGGSVLLTTSSRTPRQAVEILVQELDAPHYLHSWQRGMVENPYAAILASSDRLVVTGESASMIAEAVNTGKPVELFQLRERRVSRFLTTAPRTLRLQWLIRLGPLLGYWTPPRDMRRLHAALVERELITSSDVTSQQPMEQRLVDRDLARTAARVRRLLLSNAIGDAATALDVQTTFHSQSA